LGRHLIRADAVCIELQRRLHRPNVARAMTVS